MSSNINSLDPYIKKSSVFHLLDSRIKLLITIGFIVTTALLPVGSWAAFILLVAIVISVTMVTDIGVVYVIKRSLFVLPFVLAAVPLLFTVPGTVLFSMTINASHINVTAQGVERFITILLRSWISVQAAIVLISTTKFPDLLAALRSLKIPKLFVNIMGLMWRYLFVLTDEALRLIRARLARSGYSEQVKRSGGKLAWRAKVTGNMAGSLLIRSLDRSERVYFAMVARGYDGEVRSVPATALTLNSWIILLASCTLFCFILLFGWYTTTL